MHSHSTSLGNKMEKSVAGSHAFNQNHYIVGGISINECKVKEHVIFMRSSRHSIEGRLEDNLQV